jgi:hypothetical protein
MDLKCDFEHKYRIETLALNSRAAISQLKTANGLFKYASVIKYKKS